ncbi:helix-turn-helix domain-containing protein [Nocardioides alcanivorans]|uniref:helix-turn-helix domain-containing protein n=1 Tax=Nocardioides alcanivorans TaxID=2897352 RepID=UPI001F35F84F|nr:helix-turn-helix transcriptional regulator [Nocardioides alcanivorans]
MAKKFSEYARERRADQSAERREAERVFRAAYAFGHVIYSARKARNLRQSDLAELSGVAQADISRIERGQIAPTVPTLLKLADALGAQIQFVLPPGDGNSDDAEDHGEVLALSVGA